MSRSSRYSVLGLAVVLVTGTFVVFSDEDLVGYEYTGIVSDIREGENGFTFTLSGPDGSGMRCFSREEPSDLGYYAVSGEFSDDGNIFFVSSLRNLDIEPLGNNDPTLGHYCKAYSISVHD